MRKYTYLEYKICLSLLRSIILKNNVVFKINTIEDPRPMIANEIEDCRESDVIFLICVNITDQKNNWFYNFSMLEDECTISYEKTDTRHSTELSFTDYKKAVVNFYDIIKESLETPTRAFAKLLISYKK